MPHIFPFCRKFSRISEESRIQHTPFSCIGHCPGEFLQPLLPQSGKTLCDEVLPIVSEIVQAATNVRILKPDVVAQNVKDAGCTYGAELYSRYDLQTAGLSFFEGLGNSGHSVVIGDGNRPEPLFDCQTHDFSGRQGPIGCGGMYVEVNHQ